MKFLLPFVISVCAAVASAADEPKLIEVTAVAERAVDPDMIRLNVEVWSKAATASRAQALAGEELKKTLAALDAFKIRKEDMQTVSYSFGPEYVWDQQRAQNRLTGFRSTQTLQVVLRKTDQAGRFIDALTKADKGGDNPKAEAGSTVNSIQWDTSKRDEIETAGLADAVKLARRKADEIAKAADVRIKGVYRLSHAAEGEVVVRPMMARAAKMLTENAGGGTALAEGQIKVRVSVSAAYEL